MHPHHLNCVLPDPGSGCASPLSIDGVMFGVVAWSTSRISKVQVGQTVLDRYTLLPFGWDTVGNLSTKKHSLMYSVISFMAADGWI